jgi:hypothetical protein
MAVKKKAAKTKKSNAKKSHYGWVPDLPDQRDILYGAVRAVPAKLPSAVDLRPQCPPVENQGHLGSCRECPGGRAGIMEKKDRVGLKT